MSREKIANKKVHEDLSGVTITFSDDSTLSVTLDELPEEIVRHLALHGLSQKLGDSYSGEKNLTVARGKAEAVAQRLREGNWKAVREGSGGGRITDLAQALANVTGRELAEAVDVIEGMTKEEKRELRKVPAIKAEVARIAAERAAAAVSGDDNDKLAAILGGA